MADGDYTFDLYAEHPNVDINTMRLAVVQAIAGLEQAATDQADALELIDTTFVLLDGAVESIDTGDVERGQLQTRVTDLEATVADLTARLEALETPPLETP